MVLTPCWGRRHIFISITDLPGINGASGYLIIDVNDKEVKTFRTYTKVITITSYRAWVHAAMPNPRQI